MFRFANPDMFWLLAVVPALVALWWWANRLARRRIADFGDPRTVASLMPDLSPRRVRNKFVMVLTAMVCLVAAVARPQSGARLSEREVRGVEMVLAVDVSNSMLAGDLQPTRLESTKRAIELLLAGARQDRVGLVVFAGDAYVQLPVTSDYRTARQFAERLNTDMISRQGTALGKAIDVATAAFSPVDDEGDSSEKGKGGRVMVVISDGENHEDDAIAAARRAAGQGIAIYTIGIGTPEGSPIAMGRDYLRDEDGEVVLSRLDEKTMQEIAMGGAYIRATNQNFGLDDIVTKIRQTEQARLAVPQFEQYDEYFQWYIAVALLLLLLEFLMLPRRNPFLARLSVFK